MLQFFFVTIALLVLVRGVFHLWQSSDEKTPALARVKRRGAYLQIGAAIALAAFAVGMSFAR